MVFSGLVWRYAERCGAQLVSMFVSFVLARMLLPEEFGTIALITVFTNILQVFVDSGLGNALIQKKDADNLDFSTVFFANVFLCIILYIVMFFCAPFIAGFYKNDSLVLLIRIVSLTIVISGVKNIQQAYVSKTMQFKRFFYATIIGTVISAIVGIVMALHGCGVWSLVVQHLTNALIDTIILWITVKWAPQLRFSFQRLKGLFSYGSKLLVSSLLDTVYNNIWQLLIGKTYSSADLAYYNRGQQIPMFIVNNINSSIDSVLLPTFAYEQADINRIKKMTRKAIQTASYIMWPMMLGLFVVAEPVIKLILSDRWLQSVPYLRIFILYFAFYPVHTTNLNVYRALGRSDIILKLEVIKKAIGIASLILVVKKGVIMIACAQLFMGILCVFLNAFPNKKLIGYSWKEQIGDIIPSIVLSIIMGIVVNMVAFLPIHYIITLILQIIVGILVYIGLSYIFKIDSFQYIKGLLKEYILKK